MDRRLTSAVRQQGRREARAGRPPHRRRLARDQRARAPMPRPAAARKADARLRRRNRAPAPSPAPAARASRRQWPRSAPQRAVQSCRSRPGLRRPRTCPDPSGPRQAPTRSAPAPRSVRGAARWRRPFSYALIVRCRTTNDVIAALSFARRAGLEVSIRGGGHNVAGRAVTDGGVMVDLAEMKGIAIDPEKATATAEGGVIWAELNDAAARYGLAVTGGAVSGTGIAGYTLGGGLGWLMAKYGLAADNLLTVEFVTAEGDVLRADARSHADLFWALRGGGGNFGVATSFTYRLHPVQTIVGGLIAHPIVAAPELLRFYRDAVADAPDDLTVFAGLVHAPDGSGAKLAALVVFHIG